MGEEETKGEWRVITYTDFYYKIFHYVAHESQAKEYTERILTRGDYYYDGDGAQVFIPTQRILKVKIFPPGMTMSGTAKTEISASPNHGKGGISCLG